MPVTKKQLQNLRPIKKGEVRNPLGGKSHDPLVRAIKQLTALEVQEVGSLILQNNLEALQSIAKNKRSSVLKVWIASTAVKAIQKGDGHMLNAILDRIIGRVPTKVEMTGAHGGPIRTQSNSLSPEEREAEIRRLDEIAVQAGSD